MFMKQEKPEMDDFERKNFGSKGKMSKFLTDTLFFAYSSLQSNIFCTFPFAE